MCDVRHYNKKYLTEFILLYKSLPALWKVKSKEYSDRSKKSEAYQYMVEKLKEVEPNANRDLVIKKINSIRSSRRKEKNKVKKSLESGEDVYTPSLWYYDLLDFVDDQDAPTQTTSSFNFDLEDKSVEKNRPQPEALRHTDTTDSVHSSEYLSDVEQQPKRKRRETDVEVQEIYVEHESKRSPEKTTECEMYAQLLAHKLMKLDEDVRLVLMNKIDNLVFQTTMECKAKKKVINRSLNISSTNQASNPIESPPYNYNYNNDIPSPTYLPSSPANAHTSYIINVKDEM